jgi:hypothetical protein
MSYLNSETVAWISDNSEFPATRLTLENSLANLRWLESANLALWGLHSRLDARIWIWIIKNTSS